MTATTLVPLLVLAVVTCGVTAGSHRLAPRTGTWLLTSVAVAAVTSTVAVLAVLAVPAFAASERITNAIGWCLQRTTTVPAQSLGVLAAGVLIVGVVRSLRAHASHRALVPIGDAPVLVLASSEVLAYAVPGGQVVVTSGMLAALDSDERRAMFAHERAHLAHSHHRFLRTGDLCATILPPLKPVSRRILHATERWADEVAATQLGSRGLVARAVTQAGLATTAPAGQPLSMATTGVFARVQALRNAPRHRSTDTPMAILGAATCWVMVAIQVHHLNTLIAHLC